MPAPIEYEPIIEKLKIKSERDRIPWEVHDQGTFRCLLDDQYVFQISKSEDVYTLRMVDMQGYEIFSVTALDQVIFMDSKKKELFEVLRDLFELARRKALDVDKKVAGASELLDKI